MSIGEKHLHGDRPAYLSACTRLARFRPPAQPSDTMNKNAIPPARVIGFDSHPDSFTAAILCGPTPAAAITEKTFNKVPMRQLKSWARKNTTAKDLIVLEASGNSFQVVRDLKSINRSARVLESCQMGKLKEAHANNDKISAVRIGKAYLAGTAKEVWVPDPLTQERRDCFHAYSKAVKRTTQMSNRIQSYLSDNGVRLEGTGSLETREEEILKTRNWSARQRQILEGLFLEGRHAREQRTHWNSVMARDVLSDPLLLSLVRLCGIREVIAFSLGAIIGDVHRFASAKKLVAYAGLNPAYDDSGEGSWRGGIGGHGRKDLRGLLIESAQAILRTTHPLARWGRKLMARKGSCKLAVAAVARKLIVAIWYLMMGRWTTLKEIDAALNLKIGKIITKAGTTVLKQLKKTRRQFRSEIVDSLKTGRTYVLDPEKKFVPQPGTG